MRTRQAGSKTVDAQLKIDGETVALGSLAVPATSLSSTRTEMMAGAFELRIATADLVESMRDDYARWVAESKADDGRTGGPQDALAAAGYPELDELSAQPELVELVFGHYLIQELFAKLPSEHQGGAVYWLDQVDGARSEPGCTSLMGKCYRRP
jgi:hypothetical protein